MLTHDEFEANKYALTAELANKIRNAPPDYATESVRLGAARWAAALQARITESTGDYLGHLRANVAYHEALAALCRLEADEYERLHPAESQ